MQAHPAHRPGVCGEIGGFCIVLLAIAQGAHHNHNRNSQFTKSNRPAHLFWVLLKIQNQNREFQAIASVITDLEIIFGGDCKRKKLVAEVAHSFTHDCLHFALEILGEHLLHLFIRIHNPLTKRSYATNVR